jgi:hypothetical protein
VDAAGILSGRSRAAALIWRHRRITSTSLPSPSGATARSQLAS